MINEVFLLWHSYRSNEQLLIGTLRKEDNGYSFEYNESAITAMEMGCFLPFPYTNEKLYFEMLPAFFAQRMLTGEYNVNKFNLGSLNVFELLTRYDGVKNSDNFSIVSSYKTLSRK